MKFPVRAINLTIFIWRDRRIIVHFVVYALIMVTYAGHLVSYRTKINYATLLALPFSSLAALAFNLFKHAFSVPQTRSCIMLNLNLFSKVQYQPVNIPQ